jgi:hypothetical protein
MKIQIYLCPASSFVTHIPELKQAIHALIGIASSSIMVQIDDSIKRDYCMVDGRSDGVIATQVKSILHEYDESDRVAEPVLIAC